MLIIGIDPGIGGAITFRRDNEVEVYDMPETLKDMKDLFTVFNRQADDIGEHKKAYLEQVHAMPAQGVTSVWTFAENYGSLRMLLVMLSIPYEMISPMKWQARLGIPKRPKKEEDKTLHKKRLYAKAQEMFPMVKFSRKQADSLLIAEYGRRDYMFELKE